QRRPRGQTAFPYTTLFRSVTAGSGTASARECMETACRDAVASRHGRTGTYAAVPAALMTRPRRTCRVGALGLSRVRSAGPAPPRSEEHTSELQSRENLVCR